jgi:2-polyprenyl-6-methoxyphenol hydroxylase-like FAD-dependent oxidoreductase
VTEHAVAIAGGGPTGMMLAAELALAGVDVATVERRASLDLPGSATTPARHTRRMGQTGVPRASASGGPVSATGPFLLAVQRR